MPQQMRRIVVVIILVLASGYQYFINSRNSTNTTSAASSSTSNIEDQTQAIKRIQKIITNRDTNASFWTQISGKVIKNLADDREGDQHQRFLIEIGNNMTLLVAHNIDLAPRVPTQVGQPITLYGEYVWNNKGGVMHWTHHDPKGRKGGWIDYKNKRYQ